MRIQRQNCLADFYSGPEICKGGFRLGESACALHFVSARAVSGS